MINIEENVPLAPMTTFKVGGSAKYFVRVSLADDIKEAIDFAKDKDLPIFILGGGSNLIVSDDGFDGLVVKIDIRDFKIDSGKSSTPLCQGYEGQVSSDNKLITAGAAVPLGLVVNEAVKNGLGGLEWAAGIPGTVGGAVRGNAGAFGGETKDAVYCVKSINTDTGEIVSRENGQCKFGYRDSIFKHNNEIVVDVTFTLKKSDADRIKKIFDEHITYRQQKHPIEFPCAGSVFKNIADDSVSSDVRKIFEDSIKTDPFPVIPAAKIIAEAGLSGKKIGDAQISTKHTNYIINTGNAKADDIVNLIDEVRQTVWNKYKIELEIEPQLVGIKIKELNK